MAAPNPGSVSGKPALENLSTRPQAPADLARQISGSRLALHQPVGRRAPGTLTHAHRAEGCHIGYQPLGSTWRKHAALLSRKPGPGDSLDCRQRLSKTGEILVDQGGEQLHEYQVCHPLNLALRRGWELLEGLRLCLSTQAPAARGDCHHAAPWIRYREAGQQGSNLF